MANSYLEIAHKSERVRQVREKLQKLSEKIVDLNFILTLWHPLFPYGYSYKASCHTCAIRG